MFIKRSSVPCSALLILCCLLLARNGQAQLTLTLTPTLHHGYHISCFGGGDGAIDLSVTGGTPPYSYNWSTGATTQDVANLRAGFISVLVRDAGNGSARADLTLTEPYQLRAEVEPYSYPSGFNISCYSCYNGSIQVTVTAGVTPYTYAWADGPTTEDRTQLDAGSYDVDITDANGCVFKEGNILLTQPERDDWSKSGNAGSDPNSQFLGTTDNKDVVFKSNGSESLRLKSNGDIKLSGSLGGNGLLWRDNSGILRSGSFPWLPPFPIAPCHDRNLWPPFWNTDGNALADYCPGPAPVLGTLDATHLDVITANERRMRITSNGHMHFGTNLGLLPGFNIDPNGHVGILTEAQEGIPLTMKRNSGDYIQFRRMTDDGGYWAMHNGNVSQDGLAFHFYPGTGGPLYNRLVLWNTGKVSIGNATPGTDQLYNLYVEGGIATRDVRVTAGNFPDYVFGKKYELMPLPELARYIDAHGHLPHIPSAAEVVANNGVEVGDLQLRLLRTLEEQQLYIFQLEKRLDMTEQRLRVLETSDR